MEESRPLVKVENLNISFQTRRGLIHAVRDVSFHVGKGEILGVVGESGCGKSVTNMALLNLLPKNASVEMDAYEFEGENVLEFSQKKWENLRGGDLGMIFQNPMSSLNPCHTVEKQLTEALILHRPDLTSKAERKKQALGLLDLVGIPAAKNRLKCYPHELSGGMCQRVLIAQTLAGRPKLLIADEPTTALDVTIQDQILRLLKELQKEYSMGILLVTHDLGVVSQYADRIQVMYAGEVVESGPARDLIETPSHPYTIGLLSSHPSEGVEFRSKIPCIEGVVPNLLKRPSGCQFQDRCGFKKDSCSDPVPPEKIAHRFVRCHHHLLAQSSGRV